MLIFFLVLSGTIAQEVAAPTNTPVATNIASSTLPSKDLAAQAASEKLPQVSASILRTQLQQEKNPEERQKLTLRLGEILVIEHHPDEALAVLDAKDLAIDAMIAFWKAQALLASGKASEAEPLLKSILEKKNSLTQEYLDATTLALARAERALGKNEEALTTIATIPANSSLALPALEERCAILLALKRNMEVERLLKDQSQLTQQPRLLYLYALAAWQRGDQAEALKRFNMKTESSSSGRWTSAATVAGIANCEMALQKPAEAQALLEKYLQENPNTPRLPELMAQLEELYTKQNTNLSSTSTDAANNSVAPMLTSSSMKDKLNHCAPSAPSSSSASAILKTGSNKDGMIFYTWANDATQPYRASYAMLPLARMLQRQGHLSKSEALEQSFLTKFPDHPLAGEVRLELAQNKLNQGDPAGALSFINDNAAYSSNVRARMAFLRGLAESSLKHAERAEQEFHQAELLDPALAADAEYNQMLLRFATDPMKEQSSISPQQQKILNEAMEGVERKEYLEILNSDHGDQASANEVIKKARAFLAAHPNSSFMNEVRMKLGEALLKKGLVREARVELENVGHAESNSELGRQALLLAAQAAAHSMDPKSVDDAVMILEQVAQSNKGSYDAWQARLEQAALKNAQALPLEAIAIDDQILAATDVPLELRYAAQMAKGDTLSGLGAKDPSNYRAAIATWRALADMPGVPSRWRNQALCKIGLIEEKLKENDVALATYYEAIKTPRLQEPEQLWHDKAAFEAARLLEERHQWNEAIQLYQQIISEGGPRAAEAKARVSKLRLENFLWD